MGHRLDADLAALEMVSADLAGHIELIKDDQWKTSTPCDGWDLSALIDHVVGGNWFSIRILQGADPKQAMEYAVGCFAGRSASAGAARTSLDDQLAAFGEAGAMVRPCQHVAGELTGRQVLRLRLHDLIVHAWDVAETLGAGAAVSSELAYWAVGELADNESLTARHFGITATHTATLDAAHDVRADDGGATYLRLFGRTPKPRNPK